MNLFKFRDTGDEAKPLIEHIEDLRWTLIRCVSFLLGAMVLSFAFRTRLAAFLQGPLEAIGGENRIASLQSLGVADSFTISLELAFYSGLVLSFPFILYFLAGFALPALTAGEKRVLLPVCAVGFFLFLGGVAFCYYVILPTALSFFFEDATKTMGWQPTWTVREYYSFVTQLLLAFGVSFQLPLVVLALVKLDLIDSADLARVRPYALVIICVISAILTPPDIFTLALMAGPMYVLYEICIWVAHFFGTKKSEDSDE